MRKQQPPTTALGVDSGIGLIYYVIQIVREKKNDRKKEMKKETVNHKPKCVFWFEPKPKISSYSVCALPVVRFWITNNKIKCDMNEAHACVHKQRERWTSATQSNVRIMHIFTFIPLNLKRFSAEREKWIDNQSTHTHQHLHDCRQRWCRYRHGKL